MIITVAIFLLVHLSFLLGIGMVVIVARKSQSSQTRTAFLMALGTMTIWNVGTLLEMDFRIATGVTYMPFIAVCYIGICLAPIMVLYLGKTILQSDWQPRPRHALFLVIPLVSMAMVFTNSFHQQFFVHFSLYSSEAVYGAYYYFHSLYSYGCIAAGVTFMIIASFRNSGIFSKQSLLVGAGVVTAAVPNMLYSFGVGNLPFSISTVAFTVTLLCFSVAFLKYRFTTALPITMRQVVDLISDGYLVVDKHLLILDFNQALLRLFPEPVSLTYGTGLRAFIEKYFIDTFYDKFLELHARAVAQKETAAAEAHILGDTYVNVEVTPVIQHNVHIGSIILLKNITQSKMLIEATQAASRAKGEFLSHMSHEIRTPLNAIIGMINIGMSTDDIEKKDYCFERADSASKHLLGLINDVLDMSKIESDKFELSYSEFDFEKMLMNVANVASVRAEEKQQNFVVNFNKGVPAYIKGDELRLSQVITNLLTNAIKFTPEKGTVTLGIEKIEDIGGEVRLRIEVADTGIGISREQQERLFTSFSQADASITKKFGGTGLGLAISKRIVELMGGEIWVESELGQGAKFIFTMQVKKAAEKPRTQLAANIRKESINILAIDDSVETRDYFVHVMEALKLSCDVASCGEEALDKIQNAGDKPYNIFFVDWKMPGMDGLELTKRIRAISDNNPIVIMISVADWSTVKTEAIAAGVKHFVPKPLFPSALINAINICIGAEWDESADSEQQKGPKRSYDFYNYTVLIVEDVDINREIISAILEETNISIDYAENGKIAVAMFCEYPEKYDAILMDINMPEMDGYEATRTIRALDLERAKNIPIIAMTANVFKEDIEKCLASGMNDHTGKPVDTDALFGMLKKYFTHQGENRKMKSVHELEQGIAWDEGLLTGNVLVDMQHQRIFERVSDLVRSCEDGSNTAKLQDTLEFLVNYTIRHFTDEEALLLECGYPNYADHKQEHNEFKKTVGELARKFEKNGSSEELCAHVNRITVRWLVSHTQQEDRKISEHIRSLAEPTQSAD